MKKLLLALILVSGATLGFGVASADPTPVVVHPGDMQGWAFFDESTLGGVGSGELVGGPGSVPLGFGSAHLETTAGGGATLYKYLGGYEGLRLADLSVLEYSTYHESADQRVPNFQMDVDYNCDYESGHYDGRLVYIPQENGTVSDGAWDTWNLLDGVWFSSKTSISDATHTGPEAIDFHFSGTPKTLDDILAVYPDACIHPVWGGFGAKIGTYSDAREGNVDKIVLNDTTFDFEPAIAARVNGGGHLLEGEGKRKDWFDVSFGLDVVKIDGLGLTGTLDVVFHNTSKDDINKAEFVATSFSSLNLFDGNSLTCTDAMNLTAHGELDGVPGYKVVLRSGDNGSPNTEDTVRVTLYKPGGGVLYDTHDGDFTDESSCVGSARTGLDKGNITITNN